VLAAASGSTALGMKYNRFEELPVWKSALSLAMSVYSMTAGDTFKGHRSLRDQLERAQSRYQTTLPRDLKEALLKN